MSEEIENWLDAKVYNCPNCGNGLFEVGHSPFADEDIFYCDTCPKRVDVSFYDKKRNELANSIDRDNPRFIQELIQEIELNLKNCDCGGKYKYYSPRRCSFCSNIVIEKKSSVELYPDYFYYKEDRDPTEEECVKVADFNAEFVITKDIWR